MINENIIKIIKEHVTAQGRLHLTSSLLEKTKIYSYFSSVLQIQDVHTKCIEYLWSYII